MSDANATLDAYLCHCRYEKRLDAKTLKAYRCDLEQFEEWLISCHGTFTSAGKAELTSYLGHLNARFAPSSAKRKIASLRAFYSYCEAEELVPASPFRGFKVSIREPKRLPRTIPLADLGGIFRELYSSESDAFAGSSEGSVPDLSKGGYRPFCLARDRAIVEVLLATGLRVSELCGLDDQDFDQTAKTLLIFGKGAKERVIQVENKSTLDALVDYLAKRNAWQSAKPREASGSSNPIFVNRFNQRLAEQSVRALISKHANRAAASIHITPHMFRHTFATLLLEEDVDIRYIQRLLGHSSIKTTEIYTHVTSAKLREILKEHNPRNAIV